MTTPSNQKPDTSGLSTSQQEEADVVLVWNNMYRCRRRMKNDRLASHHIAALVVDDINKDMSMISVDECLLAFSSLFLIHVSKYMSMIERLRWSCLAYCRFDSGLSYRYHGSLPPLHMMRCRGWRRFRRAQNKLSIISTKSMLHLLFFVSMRTLAALGRVGLDGPASLMWNNKEPS